MSLQVSGSIPSIYSGQKWEWTARTRKSTVYPPTSYFGIGRAQEVIPNPSRSPKTFKAPLPHNSDSILNPLIEIATDSQVNMSSSMSKILKSIIFNLSTKNIKFFTKKFFPLGSFFLHRGHIFAYDFILCVHHCNNFISKGSSKTTKL